MDNDNPISPYSSSEQQQIMRDVQESHRQAVAEHDVARTFYTNELINHDND